MSQESNSHWKSWTADEEFSIIRACEEIEREYFATSSTRESSTVSSEGDEERIASTSRQHGSGMDETFEVGGKSI